MDPDITTADTAFMFLSTALVQFMTPGLAFFYSGAVGMNCVLSVLMQSLAAMGIVMFLWYFVGFSLTYGKSYFLFGDPFEYMCWKGLLIYRQFSLDGVVMSPGFPGILFAMYQTMFAVIAPALIGGALVGRLRFGAYLVFVILWCLFVYAPVAHWTWGGGWIVQIGGWDFAGGLVVHQSTGFSALAGVVIMGNRRQFQEVPKTAHSLPLVVLGTAMLWFGWFGFNGGSSLANGGLGAIAFINTHMSASVACLSWILLEWTVTGKPKLSGACAGAVAGMVGITPAAGYVQIWGAIVIGMTTSAVCFSSLRVADHFNLDDTCDVWAIHGVGAFFGNCMLGLLADGPECADRESAPEWCINPGTCTASLWQAWIQFLSAVVTAIYAFVGTALILKGMMLCGRISYLATEESVVDKCEHGEIAYSFGGSDFELRHRRGSWVDIADETLQTT